MMISTANTSYLKVATWLFPTVRQENDDLKERKENPPLDSFNVEIEKYGSHNHQVTNHTKHYARVD